MHPIPDFLAGQTRRAFLGKSALGLGTAALSTLLPARAAGAIPGLPHFAPKAKRAIFLHMNGGPSQIDLFDYKPKLEDLFDKDLPESVRNGQRLTTMTSGQKRFPLAPSKFKFERRGKSGMWMSELLPWTAKMADELTVVRTVNSEAINHDPAVTYLCTGNQIPGKPSLGSWLSYGLGTMNKNLPDFVVMTPSWSSKTDAQAIYNRLWSSGFLPGKHQGVALRSQGDPVLFLSNPDGVEPATRRKMLDSLGKLNQQHFDEIADLETQTRITQYEMAFRMQTSVPELMDLSKEDKRTLAMYGPEATKPGTFAASCLLARRLIERDVRFVQLFHRGWDQHGNIAVDLPAQCRDVDQAGYALVTDLKQRGLLKDTLVVWTGEFGRTVYCQGGLTKANYGRDHHPRCWTMWMAGAGLKPGFVYGETDDFSYNITRDPVHLHELNATVLHSLGIDNNRFTATAQGLDQRLTGVEEHHPVKALFA
ncbi:DUF1501 domain-containing protein [Limnoglobus roseus]|uniref:Sulfatase n=1 Tax=Limnoglobus roseus TaxID=2598579 RepID=A0A5C1ALD1_9BACT|nr:DUF1501 domain-containing protein [Limnoglobus roseus]QEL18997.1 hypothetical protein PX52LOC_06047 [Limnoglobus roseus]